MKKVILMTLVAVFLLTSTVCAFADTTTYQPDSTGKYNVTYNVGAANKGEMYGFVVIKGTGVIDLDNIDDYVYIDQATADENGNITFTNFGLKGPLPSDDNFVESTAYIGGKGYPTAQTIGVMVAKSAGNAITGTVTDTKNPREATVTFKNASGIAVATATTTSGAFSVEVDEGTYTVVFTKDGSASFTYTNVVINGDKALKAADMSDLAGDVIPGGQILVNDVVAIAGNFRKTSGFTNDYADMDLSGQVLVNDILVPAGNFRNSNTTQVYAD